MKLETWLKEQNLTPEAFGDRVFVTGMTIRRYLSGRRLPKPEIASRIVDETGEAVTLQDLYDCYLVGKRNA